MVKALFPGTFDPIHYGHIDIAERAARLFDEVIMAVYDRPLKSLMFLPDERMELVREAFKRNPKIRVTGYSGLTVDFCRKAGAQVIDARVVDDGDIITAGGVTSGIDLGLYLVERFANAEIAGKIANAMEYERSGPVWKHSERAVSAQAKQ